MDFEDLSNRLQTQKAVRISAHILFWSFELLLFWYTTIISFNAYKDFGNRIIWQLALANTLSLVLVYYPLVYLVIPLLKKKKYLFGIFGITFLLIVYSLLNAVLEREILFSCQNCMLELKIVSADFYRFLQRDLFNRVFAKVVSMGMLIGLIFSVSLPLAIKIAIGSFRQQISAIKLAKENVELEFNFLKSQVNPHFLFNSLNNIYGLILKNENAKAASTVARLAEFMRYTLYNSTNDKSSLEKEVQLIKDYVALEQIRLNYTQVEFDMVLNEPNYELPTLLLMPLIENAFKFSVDSKDSVININLSVTEGLLTFIVSNTINENHQPKIGGIGLKNLQKRLDLYYPNKHTYLFSNVDKKYKTTISIQL